MIMVELPVTEYEHFVHFHQKYAYIIANHYEKFAEND